MWKAWRGSSYGERQLLLLGESAYAWRNTQDEVIDPGEDHLTWLVLRELNEYPSPSRFTRMLTKAICGKETPTIEEVRTAWKTVAFTNYVPDLVGEGARVRPSVSAWTKAAEEWPGLLEALAPKIVIVLGQTIWKKLPQRGVNLEDGLREYRLATGSPVHCWRTWHPASGLSWSYLAGLIKEAEARSR